MKKIIVFGLTSLFILLLGTACRNPIHLNSPCVQSNTKWESEDGLITFTVDGTNAYATGSMIVDSESVEFYMTTDMGAGMHLFAIEVLDLPGISPEDEYEYWRCSYKSKKKFVATVKETTYFNVGDKITFYRVDDDSSD